MSNINVQLYETMRELYVFLRECYVYDHGESLAILFEREKEENGI